MLDPQPLASVIARARSALARMSRLVEELPHGASREEWAFVLGADTYEDLVIAWLDEQLEAAAEEQVEEWIGPLLPLTAFCGCRLIVSNRERSGVVLVRRAAYGDPQNLNPKE